MTLFGEEKQHILLHKYFAVVLFRRFTALLQDIGDDMSFLSLKRVQGKFMGETSHGAGD